MLMTSRRTNLQPVFSAKIQHAKTLLKKLPLIFLEQRHYHLMVRNLFVLMPMAIVVREPSVQLNLPTSLSTDVTILRNLLLARVEHKTIRKLTLLTF